MSAPPKLLGRLSIISTNREPSRTKTLLRVAPTPVNQSCMYCEEPILEGRHFFDSLNNLSPGMLPEHEHRVGGPPDEGLQMLPGGRCAGRG
jgi:hypothetical protein